MASCQLMLLDAKIRRGGGHHVDWKQIELLHQWVSASHDAVTALHNNSPKAAKFVTAALMLAECVGKCSELTQKTSQLLAMKEEHKRASERLTQVRAILFTDSDLASIDAAAVRRLRKEALDLQITTSRPLAVMSLNLCENSEERALDVICKLPLAKRVLKVFRNPACAAEFVGELDLSATQVRSIQTRLRDAETKTAADELQAAWSATLESLKQAKLAEVSRQEKADKGKETEAIIQTEQYPRNGEGRIVYLPVGTRYSMPKEPYKRALLHSKETY